MSKKVLILSSSPRKSGNSDLLCNSFLQGAMENGHEAEKVFLKEKKIRYCQGCGTCYNQQKPCPQRDDMQKLLHKMMDADVIVMASPVYFYSIAGQMKTLIDRCCSKYTQLAHKDFYFIMTAADEDKSCMQRTLECFRGFTDCLDDTKEKGVIFATGVWQIGDVKATQLLHQAYNMGKAV